MSVLMCFEFDSVQRVRKIDNFGTVTLVFFGGLFVCLSVCLFLFCFVFVFVLFLFLYFCFCFVFNVKCSEHMGMNN